TPPYQAPDADLTRWDVSTDLFAVGVMLYQLLCNGQHPYPGSKPMVGEKVIDPRMNRSDLSDGLAEFLVKACSSHRSDRFSTAQAHCLGSKVLAPSPLIQAQGVTPLLVIDGQQRLTALFLALCALRHHVAVHDRAVVERFNDRYLINKYGDQLGRLRLLPTQA